MKQVLRLPYTREKMMKTRNLLAALLFTLFGCMLAPAGYASDLAFPRAGFRIAPMDVPPGDTTTTPLFMMLPPEQDFAANVNVQIQPFKGSAADYDKLSLQQMKDARMKLLRHQVKGDTVIYEYTGSMNSRALHWYVRAYIRNKHAYLATATALDALWGKDGKLLTRTVDSFRLK